MVTCVVTFIYSKGTSEGKPLLPHEGLGDPHGCSLRTWRTTGTAGVECAARTLFAKQTNKQKSNVAGIILGRLKSPTPPNPRDPET